MSIDERPDVADPATPSAPTGPGRLRPLVLRIHFWAGVLVGPFLFVAAVTGAAYAATGSLEPLLYRSQLRVPAGPGTVPLAEQVRIGTAAMPGTELSSVRPGAGPTDTTRVIATAPDLPESYSRTAFVDPHTGALRGVLDTYGSSGAMPVRAWVDELHRNLHLGEPGRLYTELAASWLWVMVLGGLTLWIGLVRRRRGARRRASAVLVPRTTGPRRGRLLSWHAVVGVWATTGLLILSATGLTWSTYAGENVTELREALSWTTPDVATELPGAGPAVTDPAAFDTAAAAAARTGLVGPYEITPGGAGEAWTVTQIESEWPQRLDSIAVDPGTGQVVDTVRFADWPLAAKLASWGIDAHMGLLFGLPNQIVLVALGLGLACMVVWGWVLWWRRGPGQRPGSAPPGGVLRSLPVRWQVGVWAVAVAIGLVLPLLGASLVAFLLAETLLDRRRTGTGPGVTPEADGEPARV